MRWHEFATECPELAPMIRDRFEREQIVLLGTVRPDGSPRISAVECDFSGGDLMTSMIWQSIKALDLLRDGRVTIHSLVPDKAHEADNQGDLKLYGRALAVTDPGRKREYEDAIHSRIDWHPPEPYHCFAFTIHHAAVVQFVEDARRVRTWRATAGLTERVVPV